MELLVHGIRVANISLRIKSSPHLWISSILHDVGKLNIDANILCLKRRLNQQERAIIESHSKEGYEITKNFNKNVANIILHHHENFDGSGYPYGLKGEEIPYESRIIRIADVYDALINERPYKRKFAIDEAIEIMCKEKKNFDPILFERFLKIYKLEKNILIY